MTIAAFALLALVFGLVAFDWATLRGKNRRALLLEVAVFVAGAFFIVLPHRATALAHAIEDGADVAFGNRFLGDSNVPPGRRAVLVMARWFERAITGLRLADAHNGLRAFGRGALELVRIRQNRMAHATEIKLLVSKTKLRIVEVPVSVRYTPETLERGQTNAGAALILRDLMLQYLFGDSK